MTATLHQLVLLFVTVSCLGGRCCLADFRTASSPKTAENEIDVYSRHVHSKSPASQIQDEVDILKLMNVSGRDQGISVVPGPISRYAAYKFRLPYENVPLANSSVITSAMSSTAGFTVVFVYRQQKYNLGTLISVHSPGRLTPWFQLTSNSKTNMLSLKYRAADDAAGAGRLHQVDWSLPSHHRKSPLAAWIWMSLSVDVSTSTLRLDLDCLPSRFEALLKGSNNQANPNSRQQQQMLQHQHQTGVTATSMKHSKIGFPADSLVYFRQEPGRKKKFLGSMQVAKILPYVTQDRLWNCLHISEHQAPQHRKPMV